MKISAYLHTGDLVTLSFQGLSLGIQSLTQSTPTMKQNLQCPINSYFLLTTKKCLQTSIKEQKSLTSFKDDQIYYGQPIIFYHLLSGKFLAYSNDIENKSSIQLINAYKINCQFSIKPIFKCQTVVTRKIRAQQSVILSPMQVFNREGNISLVVLKNQNRKFTGSHSNINVNPTNRYYVCMKKNQHTMLNLTRINMQNFEKQAITNIQIYQICNIQTKKNLFAAASQSKHRDIVTFQKSINQLSSYFDLKIKTPQAITNINNNNFSSTTTNNNNINYNNNKSKQQKINYNQIVYLHSWKQHKYLGINLIGDICLSRQLNQDCQFVFQPYSDDSLTNKSVVRIKHISTNKYISINNTNDQIQVISEARLIDTYFINVVPVQNLRVNIFVNDACIIIQRELSSLSSNKNQTLTYRNKKTISKVLKQLINFIFGSITIQQFMSMKNQLLCRLSSNDQKLLADVGMIQIMVRLFKLFIEEINKNQGQNQGAQLDMKDKTEQHNIISYIMMNLTGICLNNTINIRLLMQELPVLYESLGYTIGVIQCLYHLFKDSKELLLILENTYHRIGKKQVSSFEVLLTMISNQKFQMATKCKVLKLIQALIIVNSQSKILGHETCLLKFWKQKKLQNILLITKYNDHHDLMVYLPQKQGFQQLDQMLTLKKNYEKQLQLLKNQLQLICSMCFHSSSHTFIFISSMITQQMILRYLKTNLQPDIKQIFMRLLLDIYLCKLQQNLTKSKAFIIVNEKNKNNYNNQNLKTERFSHNSTIRQKLMNQQNGQQLMEVDSRNYTHSKTIERIQNLVLEVTRKAINNQIIDSSFYMNIKALKNFLALRILDQDQVRDFRSLLTNFIAKYTEQSFKQIQKKKITLQIIKIIKQYVYSQIQQISQNFIINTLPKQNYQNPILNQTQLFQKFTLFTKDKLFFNTEIVMNQFKFVPQLIKQSLAYQDQQIFIASSQLLRIIYERQNLFIGSLKNKIIIESNWSYNFYKRVIELKRNIIQDIQEFVGSQRETKKADLIQENLNRKLEQLNFMYYETENDNIKVFSSLVQNIYREMGLFQIIVGFLNDSQKKFKQKRSKQSKIDVYSTCFEFISMFLRDNQQNFQKFRVKYLDIKFVFEHADRGQIKFLNHLIKMPKARQLMLQQIMDCIMLSFQHNTQPNPYTILALLNIMTYPHIDKQRIQELVQNMIRNPKIFEWLIKVSQKRGSYTFLWSYNNQHENYHKDWLIYIMLVTKLLLVILQTSSQRTTFAIQIIKYLDLSKIIQLLQCPDLLSSISLQNLQGTLLKKQIMKLFNKIYVTQIEKQLQQTQNILAYIQSTFQNLTYIKQDVMGANSVLIDQILKNTNDHQSIIYQSDIYPPSKNTVRMFQANFNQNYLIVIHYYPFIVRILDLVINSASLQVDDSLLKRQSIMLLDTIYRKYKDYVQNRLTYGQFNKYPKQYQNAIYAAQQLFKRKINFNIEIQDQQYQYQGHEIQIQDIFLNRKIQNTIKCYQFSSNNKQKHIYQAFIIMFHSNKFKEYLQEQERRYVIKLNIEEIKKMIELFQKCLVTKKEQMRNLMEIFQIFLMHNQAECRDLSYNHLRERIMQVLENQKDDLGNKKIQSYISMTLKLFTAKINRKQHSTTKQITTPFKQSFLTRLNKQLISQKKLYSGSKINQQCMIYIQNKNLTFEHKKDNLTIEQILQWIRNMIILAPYKIKIKYSSLFFEIVDLLKTYNDFIRDFNSKYISQELYGKINLCLEIMYHYISGGREKNILVNYLIQRQIWNDLNLILNLDDSWNKNIQEISQGIKERFAKAVRGQIRFNSRSYLSQAQTIYLNSKNVYKTLIPDQYFPLLPIKSLFSQAKSNVISILKQFNHYTLQIKQQLYSRMQISIINKNIFDIYVKHERLFDKYDIPSVQIDIDYHKGKDQLYATAQNLMLENGVDLTGIKMHIQDICSSSQVKNQYYNLRLDGLSSKKIQSAFSSIIQFVKDFCLLFISCFLKLCRKNKKNREIVGQIDDKKFHEIIKFFLQRLGRVQLSIDNKLYYVDFMIRPECRTNKYINNKFIEKINFVSMQLKLQSIYREGIRYMLYYQNQINFYRRYNRFTFITFLTKNFEMIIYLNFAVIVGQNIVLIINSNSDQSYFVDTSLSQPFVWLQIASTIGAGLIMIAYCIKDFPLLLKNINLQLRMRSQSYGSNYSNYNILIKSSIKLSMIIMDPSFAYHVIYSIIVALVFINKLFVALLLLDVYFQIPNLKNLLMSIWRPKLQLFLAIVSFILVQYFFSIFMFFNFKQQTAPYCNTLGSCFGFVFVTTYKAVGGFVGYLFQQHSQSLESISVDFFQIFQDVYVVLVYQIFFALILAIIIDTFSLIRHEQSSRKQYLDSCCIVCNLDKTKFNSTNLSFRSHIAITHNIWNYFYYYQYVFTKDVRRRNVYERQIYLNRNANWLPTNVTRDVQEDDMENMGGKNV